MTAALLLTVRFHEGRYHGRGDWPPAPSRLFQALVAGAAKGRHLPDDARHALGWLEAQEPPTMAAPEPVAGQEVTLFVPNNDLDAVGGDPARVSDLRVGKRLRPALFDPDIPILYLWRTDDAVPRAVDGLAAGLYRLGLGLDPAWAFAETLDADAAQARLQAHPGELHTPGGGGGVPCPGPGTLASLEARHAAFLARFAWSGKGRKRVQHFAQPPMARFRRVGYERPPTRLVYDLRAVDGSFGPVPIDRAGPLVDGLRKAAAERLAAHGIDDAERLLVGRGAGADDLPRRIRIVPLPTIGHPETDPGIRRVLIEVPRTCPVAPEDLSWAMAGLAPHDPETGETLGHGRLAEAADRAMVTRFLGTARHWRTLTAAALPVGRRRIAPEEGEPKAGGERATEEAAAIQAVRTALGHAGLRAEPLEIRVQREPFDRRGSRAEAFASGTRFDKHALWHVAVAFDRPVAGPVILGNGRFTGLGLMRPSEDRVGAFALVALEPLPDATYELAHALRRAVMARTRETLGLTRDAGLPAFFHGHAEDGGPLRDGERRHLAFAIDRARNRLLVLVPHILDNRDPMPSERAHLDTLDRALEGLIELRAGKAGRFRLRVVPTADDDPLLSHADHWESLTDYTPSRHPKARDPLPEIAEDVAAQCRRRKLPVPEVTLAEKPRGLRCRLRLRFDRPVAGPLLLGRTAMRGGGLFGPVG